ncbi:unnamed protein product [Triticum turgidum subsp. durum]|uniref:Uncharacterized protein n=1 Tax=Triticum turgidum subsp. durum TaxID=4567 RepID=A0A9R0RAQ7_TRITD|nr:unnamed protein product [Triticum turgidum subsp. durum]
MQIQRGDVQPGSSNRRRKKMRISSENMIRVNPLEEEFGTSSDSGEGVWRLLSEEVAAHIDDSVVSLASFHKDNAKSVYFACTGIIIESNSTITSFLTSLSLLRSIDDDSKIFQDMMIEVRLPNNHLSMGWLEYYDLKYNVAVISIAPFHVFRAAFVDHQRQFESHSEVVAVGRCFDSGKLMATTGMLTDNGKRIYREELAISTCEITMTGVGGPLVDFNGDFVGMNFYSKEETPFLPRNKILELLMHFRRTSPCWDTSKKRGSKTERGASKAQMSPESHKSDLEGSSRQEMKNKNQKPTICTICDPELNSGLEDTLLESLPSIRRWPYDWGLVSLDARRDKFRFRGYPLPVLEDNGKRLRYSFEEEFSEDIWNKLSERAASNMSRVVVALASFSGEARLFACTGVFIDSNGFTTRVLTSGSLVRSNDDESKVADNLKIEVHLPDKRHVTGILQHYDLHYNVAVIIIEKLRCTRTAIINNKVETGTHSPVLAIGRVYESGKLMAASGIVINKESKLDCKDLRISTCQITKAGIGGPLIDSDGNFIGMNFYGLEETPYMPRDTIVKLLGNFDAKGTADFTKVPAPNRFLKYYYAFNKTLIQICTIHGLTYDFIITDGLCLSHIGAIRCGMNGRKEQTCWNFLNKNFAMTNVNFIAMPILSTC